MSAADSPEISVVVPVRRAVETAEDTLVGLLDRGGLEVIAIVSRQDPTTALLRDLQRRRPELVLIEIDRDCSVPQLRAHGVRAARGRLVAITEDHCAASPDWPAVLAPAFADPSVGAAGGGVVNGRTSSLRDWAIYFSRYAALMPPLPRGPAPALPGNNACYRRELLKGLQPLYEEGFWEHELHQELHRQGLKLWQEPAACVTHRKPYRFVPYCALRFRHARCFGGMIRRKVGLRGVAARAALAPLTPLLQAARSARAVLAKQTRRKEYFLALPLLMILYSAWAAGELTGYLLGAGQACSRTD